MEQEKTKSSHRYEYARFCATLPQDSYREGEDFYAWQAAAREQLKQLLGLPLPTCEPFLEMEYTKDCDTHTEHRFTVQTEPGYVVPCHLLIPKGRTERIPLTLCLSGHATGMHIVLGAPKNEQDEQSLEKWPPRAIAPRVIREGRAALVIEARNFGESSVEGYGTSCTEAAKIAMMIGRTIIGERVSDAMRILDAVLEHFPLLDPEGILCTGNSGGGTATFYLACIDERIAIAAPSCAVCTYEDSIAAMRHCACNHIPNMRKHFEMGDLGGLIAPRRLIVAAGEVDPIFPLKGVKKAYETIERLYRCAGAPDACALVVGSDGHFFYADEIWKQFYEMQK